MTSQQGFPDPALAKAVQGLGDTISEALGDNFIGLYLDGSFAWGTAIPASDVDLRIVTNAPVGAAVRPKFVEAAGAVTTATGRTVDLQFDVLGDLIRIGAVRFQHTELLRGRDVRPLVPLKSLESFAQDSISSARRLAVTLRQRHHRPTTFPLGLPDPTAEFRGYEGQLILDHGTLVPSSKRLVTNVLAVATAFVAKQAAMYVPNKHEVAGLYAETIGGEWRDFVQDIYATYRTRLGYRLPTDPAERRRLTRLCERATDFENQLMLLGEPDRA